MRKFKFRLELFKPSHKWYETIETTIECRSLTDYPKRPYMYDAIEVLKQEFSTRHGWYIFTTHEEGYPVLIQL